MLKYTPLKISDETAISSRRALFLDRDGVINTDVEYVHRIEDFEFIDGIFELCRRAVENNYHVIIITNQSGIARGYYSEADLEKLTQWMFEEFRQRGVDISCLYACPHLSSAKVDSYRKECHARKPEPGMLLRAQKDFSLELPECAFIGDNLSDMKAGINAGVGKLFLLDGSYEPDKTSDFQLISTLAEASEKLFG
jgi:D-glycero-D-manno-heptose 1,7-bisphosphate phosphatase